MRGSLRLNRHKPRTNLHSSQLISTNSRMRFNSHTCNEIPISKTTSRTSTHSSNYTLREGVEETLEDKVEEVDFVGEEVQLHAITVDNWVTFPEIV